MRVSIFRIRPFLVENLVLGITNLVFIPVFFFGSEYAQISLAQVVVAGRRHPAVLLHRLRHRRADRRADAGPGRGQAAGRDRLRARRRRVLPVGGQGHRASASARSSGTSSWPGPAWASCSARPAPTRSTGPAGCTYGEATGITQTVRNYAASMGLAILGTILVTVMRSHVTNSLISLGAPAEQQGGRRGGEPVAVARQRQRERGRGIDPALLPGRLRPVHADRAVRDGRRSWRPPPSWPSSGLRGGVQQDIGSEAQEPAQESAAVDNP